MEWAWRVRGRREFVDMVGFGFSFGFGFWGWWMCLKRLVEVVVVVVVVVDGSGGGGGRCIVGKRIGCADVGIEGKNTLFYSLGF